MTEIINVFLRVFCVLRGKKCSYPEAHYQQFFIISLKGFLHLTNKVNKYTLAVIT